MNINPPSSHNHRLLGLYDALLRLYPAEFRSEFGAEMRGVFVQRLLDNPDLWSGLHLIGREFRDLPLTLFSLYRNTIMWKSLLMGAVSGVVIALIYTFTSGTLGVLLFVLAGLLGGLVGGWLGNRYDSPIAPAALGMVLSAQAMFMAVLLPITLFSALNGDGILLLPLLVLALMLIGDGVLWILPTRRITITAA